MELSRAKELDLIAQALFDKKGANILVLDVRAFSSMNDFTIIAEGTVERHVRALSAHMIDTLSDREIYPIRTEGGAVGDWIVVDYGDIVIHLLTPEMREKYALEELWQGAAIVEVKIDVATAKESHKG